MNNYFKRKAKADGEATTEPAEVPAAAAPVNEYPNIALDVMLIDGQYQAVLIEYNLETGRARIVKFKPTTRLIGLSFDEKKRALRSLTGLQGVN